MVNVRIRGLYIDVTVDDDLLQKGWYAGQWVTISGNRTVSRANAANRAGFLLNGFKLRDVYMRPFYFNDGSLFVPHEHENSAITGNRKTPMICDSGDFDFNPNVYDTTQVYNYNDYLYVNNNGVLTNVPTGFASVGHVLSKPEDNNGWLGFLMQVN